MEYMTMRIQASYINKQIDIYTKKGLTELASLGKLTDHLHALPCFTKKEIIEIFEYIKKRDKDKDDTFNFYISKEGFNTDELIFVIYPILV